MENPKCPYKEHPTVAFCFECPSCGEPIPWQVVWLMNDYWHGLKHCPNCGAEMRKEANDEP